MRGAFSDPQGPRPWRFAAYLPAILLAVSTFTGVWEDATGWAILTALGLTTAVGLFPRRQWKSRSAEIVCGAGNVRIRNAGTRNQVIHARQIAGASTARVGKKLVLTLAHHFRDEPIAIEVETEEEVERIRHALGIGHGGFGHVGWRTTASTADRAGLWGRATAVTMTILAIIMGAVGAGPLAAFLGLFAAIGFLFALVSMFSGPPPASVVMASGGLGLASREGWFTIPYATVHDIEIQEKQLLFVIGDPAYAVSVPISKPWNSTGVSRGDAEVLVAQIRAASARARGFGKPKEDPTGRVESLRRHGESPRDWLVRLDMAGQTLGGAAGGYRGFSLDTDDLWRILEDPEADADLRAGAARVLRHSQKPETRVRIDATLAAVRDDLTAQKLRVAIRDDLENACGELAEIDAREQMKRYAAR